MAKNDELKAIAASIERDSLRADFSAFVSMLQDITGETPRAYPGRIVGFGSYHYTYGSGREGDAPLVGISPRKSAITVYLAPGFADEFPELVQKAGKVKAGKGCLYVASLSDIDKAAFRRLVEASSALLRARYPANQPPISETKA